MDDWNYLTHSIFKPIGGDQTTLLWAKKQKN